MILNWLSRLSTLPRWLLVSGSAATGFSVSAASMGASPARAEASKAEITVLYDAFGKTSTMKKDWGFSALIEYGDKRILFDTGNNAEIFAHNVEAKGIDLTKLDFAVVSHRHGDHTSGLNHLLKVNPSAVIRLPVNGRPSLRRRAVLMRCACAVLVRLAASTSTRATSWRRAVCTRAAVSSAGTNHPSQARAARTRHRSGDQRPCSR